MNRLESIVSLVDKCTTVADIGTDHGYVADMLLRDKICDKIIATDVNKGPLDSARNHLTLAGYNEKVDFRLGSGLTVLNSKDADIAIIAGMGGELIAKILDDSKDVVKSLKSIIIQPMTNIDTIRKYIIDNNMSIEEEIIVKEYHFYYFVMKVINKPYNNSKTIDEIYYTISKYLYEKRNPMLLEYIKKLYKKNIVILDNLKNSKNISNEDKSKAIQNQNKKLELMIKNYEG